MLRSLALAALLSGPAVTAAAQTIQCGEPYVVRRGDTLQRIAERAYGRGASFRALLPANTSLFARRDPSLIEIGDVLMIPCRNGPAIAEGIEEAEPAAEAAPDSPDAAPPPADTATAEAAAPATDAEPETAADPTPPLSLPVLVAVDPAPTPRPPARPVLLIGDGPWDTASLPIHERARELVGQAPIEHVRIEDNGDPVTLLRDAARPAILLATPKPDCAGAPTARDIAGLCTALVWSAPLAEDVLTVLTRSDAEAGAETVCRTARTPAFALDPDIAALPPRSAGECLDALAAGDVDTVMAMATEGLLPPDGTVEAFGRSQLVTLHAAALADDAAAVAALVTLDRGLAALREGGGWHLLLAEAMTR